jgi:hypothetical protein
MKKLVLKSYVKFITIITLILSTTNIAISYETETHFYVTYILARAAGFNDAASKILAVSAQKIDDTMLSSPMYFELARLIYHFSGTPSLSDVNTHGSASLSQGILKTTLNKVGFNLKLQQLLAVAEENHAIPQKLMSMALANGNIIGVGKAVHSGQDNASAHVGFANGPGHGEFGHTTDDSAENTAGFENMIVEILQRLVQARQVADPADLDLNGTLTFLNDGLKSSEKLDMKDLNDYRKIASTILKKEDFQKAYMSQIKMTTQYKTLALHRIIEAYAAVGAIQNKEALWKVIPKELIEDPQVSTKDILMTLLVASEKYGGFLKYIDPDTKKEVEIMNLDKALAGDNKIGMTDAKFRQLIALDQKKMQGELNGLTAKFDSYKSAKESFELEGANAASRSLEISDLVVDKFPELVAALTQVITFEQSVGIENTKEIAQTRADIHSAFKLAVQKVVLHLKASPSSENSKMISKLMDLREALLLNMKNFTTSREAFVRQKIFLENSLARLSISKTDFMSDSGIKTEMMSNLKSSEWVNHKALLVAQYRSAERLAEDILESFIPLELNEKRHVLFENDSSKNRELHVRTKLEIWRIFTSQHFGTNFKYDEKAVTSKANINDVKAAFDVKLGRKEFQNVSFDELLQQLDSEKDKLVLSELSRRTAEDILGYGSISAKERSQKMGFDKPTEREFNIDTLKVFARNGFGLAKFVKAFTANAEASGRDYLLMTPEELKTKFPSLNQNKAANKQIEVYTLMEQAYQEQAVKQIELKLGTRCENFNF